MITVRVLSNVVLLVWRETVFVVSLSDSKRTLYTLPSLYISLCYSHVGDCIHARLFHKDIFLTVAFTKKPLSRPERNPPVWHQQEKLLSLRMKICTKILLQYSWVRTICKIWRFFLGLFDEWCNSRIFLSDVQLKILKKKWGKKRSRRVWRELGKSIYLALANSKKHAGSWGQ